MEESWCESKRAERYVLWNSSSNSKYFDEPRLRRKSIRVQILSTFFFRFKQSTIVLHPSPTHRPRKAGKGLEQGIFPLGRSTRPSILLVSTLLSSDSAVYFMDSTAEAHHRRGPPRRTNSSPFLRKPVPRDERSSTPPKARRRLSSFSSLQQQLVGGGTTNDDPSKPRASLERKSSALERHLSLLDLVAIGVGGTIGSGLFVLAGLVAHEYAGPATAVSWCLSGVAACLSGCCYAELSGRIPLAGSAYAYTYVAMGEVFAVVSAACLSVSSYLAHYGNLPRCDSHS